MTECLIYGIAVWDVRLEGTNQDRLVITHVGERSITVDNIEVAQFIYLLLNNEKVRQTIDTITSHVVLLLGRFPPERSVVVDAVSTELRNQKYSPVVFNFEGAENKDFLATVRTLANMAQFVLIDLTDLHENLREIAEDIVPHCMVPIQPLLLDGPYHQEYERFRTLQYKHRWVLAPYHYQDPAHLRTNFREDIFQPLDKKRQELRQKSPLKLFIGYASKDKDAMNTLKIHLEILQKAGLVDLWDDQNITGGQEEGNEIEQHLSDAQIVLLLISPEFLSSQERYDSQMRLALEQRIRGKAIVIPILVRPCSWQDTPLKDLQPLPKDRKPLSQHRDKDAIFLKVSQEIAEVIKTMK